MLFLKKWLYARITG